MASELSKFFRVTVYWKEEVVFEGVVRSKTENTAMANVLVNKYKGEADSVKAVPAKFS